MAELLGFEAALFLPTGTMCNVIAFRLHVRPGGDAALLHRTAHPLRFEAGGPAAVSGAVLIPLDGPRGTFDAAAVRAALAAPEDRYAPRSRLVSVEQTTNIAGGHVWPLDQVRDVVAAAREAGLRRHLDGARLMNAVVASGVPAHAWALGFDTAWIDFTKGLGAPVGACLAGSQALIDEAWRYKQMLGGAMRQAGIIAAGALWALDHHVERLAEDHEHARRLAVGLAGLPGVDLDPGAVETNIAGVPRPRRAGVLRGAAGARRAHGRAGRPYRARGHAPRRGRRGDRRGAGRGARGADRVGRAHSAAGGAASFTGAVPARNPGIEGRSAAAAGGRRASRSAAPRHRSGAAGAGRPVSTTRAARRRSSRARPSATRSRKTGDSPSSSPKTSRTPRKAAARRSGVAACALASAARRRVRVRRRGPPGRARRRGGAPRPRRRARSSAARRPPAAARAPAGRCAPRASPSRRRRSAAAGGRGAGWRSGRGTPRRRRRPRRRAAAGTVGARSSSSRWRTAPATASSRSASSTVVAPCGAAEVGERAVGGVQQPQLEQLPRRRVGDDLHAAVLPGGAGPGERVLQHPLGERLARHGGVVVDAEQPPHRLAVARRRRRTTRSTIVHGKRTCAPIQSPSASLAPAAGARRSRARAAPAPGRCAGGCRTRSR